LSCVSECYLALSGVSVVVTHCTVLIFNFVRQLAEYWVWWDIGASRASTILQARYLLWISPSLVPRFATPGEHPGCTHAQ